MNKTIAIYPTDTVWGIGGSVNNQESYELIAKIKGTGVDKPLSLIFPGIKEVKNFFLFPDKITSEWLQTFFSLGTTLGVPVSWSRTPLPSWSHPGSNSICIRCLELDFLRGLYDEFSGPITSTSLNRTGEAPITEYKHAKNFWLEHASFAQFVDKDISLSGESSTMAFLSFENEQLSFDIKREGANSEKVREHLGILIS